MPNKTQVKSVTEDLRRRSVVPPHIKALLEALPVDTHPMTQLVTLVSAMQVGKAVLVVLRLGIAASKHACRISVMVSSKQDALQAAHGCSAPGLSNAGGLWLLLLLDCSRGAASCKNL